MSFDPCRSSLDQLSGLQESSERLQKVNAMCRGMPCLLGLLLQERGRFCLRAKGRGSTEELNACPEHMTNAPKRTMWQIFKNANGLLFAIVSGA